MLAPAGVRPGVPGPPRKVGHPMVSVCMLTELESYRSIIPYKNPGGMGTNAPMVAKELERLGVQGPVQRARRGVRCAPHATARSPTRSTGPSGGRSPASRWSCTADTCPSWSRAGSRAGPRLPVRALVLGMFYNLGDVVLGATPYVAKSLARDGVKGPFRTIPNGINRRGLRQGRGARAQVQREVGGRPTRTSSCSASA